MIVIKFTYGCFKFVKVMYLAVMFSCWVVMMMGARGPELVLVNAYGLIVWRCGFEWCMGWRG